MIKVVEVAEYYAGTFHFNVEATAGNGETYTRKVSADTLRQNTYDHELELEMMKAIEKYLEEVECLYDEDGEEVEEFEMLAIEYVSEMNMGDTEPKLTEIQINVLQYELGYEGYELSDEETLKTYKRESSALKFLVKESVRTGKHVVELHHIV